MGDPKDKNNPARDAAEARRDLKESKENDKKDKAERPDKPVKDIHDKPDRKPAGSVIESIDIGKRRYEDVDTNPDIVKPDPGPSTAPDPSPSSTPTTETKNPDRKERGNARI